MDNNLAKQAIRPFTIGRKNWVCENSIHGVRASAVLYSIVETAKANELRVYDYLEFLFSELAEHAKDTSREFLQDLLPWSPVVQDKCKNRKKSLFICQGDYSGTSAHELKRVQRRLIAI